MNFTGWLNDQKQNVGKSIDWLSTRLEEQKKNAENQIMKITNENFINSILAGCALIAGSDGKVTSTEKERMAGFIKGSQIMQLFDMSEVLATFTKYADAVAADYNAGKNECISSIEKIRDNKEEAKQVINFCCIISSADGDFDDKEQSIVRELCNILQLDHKEFKL